MVSVVDVKSSATTEDTERSLSRCTTHHYVHESQIRSSVNRTFMIQRLSVDVAADVSFFSLIFIGGGMFTVENHVDRRLIFTWITKL